ncbi:MAG: ferredoxin reductase [Solirubrobacteraceae bacterium]
MAERGAQPSVPRGRRLFLRAVRQLFSPLRPDDYLEMINPLWTTKETRGKVERIEPQGSEAASVLIRPSYEWRSHKPGQYVRLGVIIDGRYHWRAYSLTSDPEPEDGLISVTPKKVDSGVVSPYLVQKIQPGDVVRLGEIEGVFTLPDPLPPKMLFISAGSGITPIMSMLRSLARDGALSDVVHVHCARSAEGVIFHRELDQLDQQHPGYRLNARITSEQGRVSPEQLEDLCPDWREREAFVCGPAGLLEAMSERWQTDGDPARLHVEHFQPDVRVGDGERGKGGTIRFCESDIEAHSDGEQPILSAGEQAGAKLPYGCRMGICHTCVGRLRSGAVRDLRTGQVHGQVGEMMRTCINAPEGPVEIEL